MLQVFQSRKMSAVFLLGFSSGLPFYLTSRTLQAWMTMAGVNLTAIGLFSLASLPYSLKFLWSPLIDRFSVPFLGRRKGWLMVSQVALSAAIAAMALQQPAQALRLVALNALLIALLSATQDLTVDAYTTDVLKPNELGPGAGVKVVGYRAAMILTGAGALIAADHMPWPMVYLLLAALMLAVTILSLRVPEPQLIEKPPASMGEAVRMPFVDFFGRIGNARGTWILAFLVLYRLGDAMISNMTTSFLLQIGFSQTDVGLVQGAMGLTATLAGVVAGAAIMGRIGLNRSLWVFGVLQAASNLAYLALSLAGRSYPLLVATIIVENFCYGMVTAAVVGFLMSLCNPRFSAAQYALLSSVTAIGRDVLAAPSGSMAETAGWPVFFVISLIAGLPGILMLPRFAPWHGAADYADGRKNGSLNKESY
jgi:PAT family beta-lactamase induction signal transducer AmpG